MDPAPGTPRATTGAHSFAPGRTLRRRVRGALLDLARGSGWLHALESRQRGAWTILTYHRVLPDQDCAGYPFPALLMPASLFECQMAWLARHAEVLPVHEVLPLRSAARSRPLVSITFDDGYQDNAELAAPILERHGLRATFFVATDFVAHGTWLWYDRAATRIANASAQDLEPAARAHGIAPPPGGTPADRAVEAWVEALKRHPARTRDAFLAALPERAPEREARARFLPMRPDQVARLAHAGHEIGSHSVTHEILTLADDALLRHELEDSRRALRAWTGAAAAGFCYPNGSHDARVAAAVAAAGYAYACTTMPPGRAASDDPWRLPRRDLIPSRVTRADGSFHLSAFRAELVGLLDPLR